MQRIKTMYDDGQINRCFLGATVCVEYVTSQVCSLLPCFGCSHPLLCTSLHWKRLKKLTNNQIVSNVPPSYITQRDPQSRMGWYFVGDARLRLVCVLDIPATFV